MEKPSIKKNFLFRLVFDTVSLIIPIITTPYVARTLGPDGCGIYSYTQANITYFVLFAVLGTYSYGLRTISRNRDNKKEYSKLFWEIELLTVITSIFSMLAFFVFYLFVNEYNMYYLVLSMLIVSALLDISWFYTGLERIGYITGVNIVIKTIGMISIFAFVKDSNDLFVYFLINSLMQVLSNLAMWIFTPKFLVKVSIRELHIFRHFKDTLIFFIPTIAISIYTVLDKTLIGVITKETSQNGYYDKATQLINIIKTFVFSSMGMIMGARTSYLFAENKLQEVKDKINLTMDYIVFLAIGCGFGILAVSDTFIPLFLGDKFEGSISLLKLMTPLIFIVGISNCLGSLYYSPVGKRRISARFIIIGSITNLLFNLLLIPRFGATGATVGTIIAESVISVLYLSFCDKYFTYKQLLLISYKKVIAGVLMFGIVFLIGLIPSNAYVVTILQIVLGGTAYTLLLVLFRDSIVKISFGLIKNTFKRPS